LATTERFNSAVSSYSSISVIFIGFGISIILSLIWSIQFWSALGLVATAIFFWDFTRKTGETIPITELMVLLAALQWIVGPYIDYHNGVDHYKYKMYVPEDVYMAFAVPVVLAFKAGISVFSTDVYLVNLKVSIIKLLNKHPRLPYLLVALGLLAPFVGQFFPAGLGFVFFLLSQVKYIGALYFILSGHPNRWPIFIGLMILSAMGSIASGMFHDLLLWSILTLSFIFHEFKSGFWPKLVILVIGGMFALTIQSVKQQYRTLSPAVPGSIAKAGLLLSWPQRSGAREKSLIRPMTMKLMYALTRAGLSAK